MCNCALTPEQLPVGVVQVVDVEVLVRPGVGGAQHPTGVDRGRTLVQRGSRSAAAIPVNEVTFERGAFVRGKDAYLGYLASALDVMGITDDFAKDNWTQGVLTAAGRESSYNPDAGNDWDVNANGPRLCDGFRANCSRGVLQTIPSTFASFHQPGTSTNIYDPVANTAAAMNYVMKRYGVLRDGSNLARSVCQFNENCGPCGY